MLGSRGTTCYVIDFIVTLAVVRGKYKENFNSNVLSPYRKTIDCVKKNFAVVLIVDKIFKLFSLTIQQFSTIDFFN